MLDSLAAQGWIKKAPDNKYHLLLIDSCFYKGVSFEQLNIDTPLRGGANLWAFRSEDAVEPYLFFAKEILIKYKDGIKEIKITELPPISNIEDTDLESFFSNSKTWKSKAFRKQKLKEKRARK